jgi:hypothetical protein
MKWAVWFSVLCIGIVAAVLALLWFFGVFGNLGLSIHGVIALFIGVSLTIVVGVGLMALVFYSGRSHHDDLIRHDLPPRDKR